MNLSKKPEEVVAVFGVPRSGTSWIGQIFNSSPHVAYRYQPLFSYEFKERINETSTKKDITEFHKSLMSAESSFVLQNENVSGKKGLDFNKENINTVVWKEVRYLNVIKNLLRESTTKVVLVVRHPCGVINSWLNAPKEFDEKWEPLQEWRFAEKKNQNKRENFYGYEKWKDAMHLFINIKEEYNERVMLIRYEDIVESTQKNTKKLFNFANLPLTRQTEVFLQQSISHDDRDPYGVFRSSPDIHKWKKVLDDKIIEELMHDFNSQPIKKTLGY